MSWLDRLGWVNTSHVKQTGCVDLIGSVGLITDDVKSVVRARRARWIESTLSKLFHIEMFSKFFIIYYLEHFNNPHTNSNETFALLHESN